MIAIGCRCLSWWFGLYIQWLNRNCFASWVFLGKWQLHRQSFLTLFLKHLSTLNSSVSPATQPLASIA
ncbi:hypothetical protein XENTR_v10017636 [Xenopus tropicalis]|nr:hypothetical protein XENTR_v10017636 [Xenopus tropicalis]